MLKKFIPQRPAPSIGEGSLNTGNEEDSRVAYREETRKPTLTEHSKHMAEHSGKDVLSSDVEIKGSIKFQKELLIDGKVEGEIQFRWGPDHWRERGHPWRNQNQVDHGLREGSGEHHGG